MKLHYNDEVWYDACPLGHDTIEKFMKALIKEGELSNPKHTNHSIHKTCLMTLDEVSIEGRHMLHLSSHTVNQQ